MKETQTQFSVIDGSLEKVELNNRVQQQKKLEPIFEEIIIQALTLEGLEEKVQKRLIGFKERAE